MSDSLIEMYDRGFERDSIVWIAITREHWLKISDRVTQLRQELSLAEEELANYAQERQWQPIETAPKRENVQILTGRFLPPGHRWGTKGGGDWWYQTSFWSEQHGLWVGFPKEVQPTHWMDLPPPPQSDNQT